MLSGAGGDNNLLGSIRLVRIMIINIRGTSGSGKSTIVKKVMESFSTKFPVKVVGRRQPLGYWLGEDNAKPKLAIPGHYESACGGCDTISGYDKIFELVRSGVAGSRHVLFEGILVSEETRRTIELHQAYPQELLVIQLSTPTDVCLGSIQARRDARGDTRPLNPSNTVNRVKTIERSCQKLQEAGVKVEVHDRDSALARIMEIINGTD